MEKLGYVAETQGNKVKVRIHRESSCGGNCAHCGGCGNDEVMIEAENTINAKVGDTVKVIMETKKFLENAALGYGGLVLAFIFGGILGYEIFETDFASAVCGFSLFGALLIIYRIRFKHSKTDIKIERL